MINDNIGGKAKSLYKLQSLNVPIPNFCVIPVSLYEKYIKQVGIENELQRLCESGNFAEAKNRILATPMPSAVEADIMEIYVRAKLADTVSVRSSAINEDGQAQSFAGQYDSFLFVNKSDIPRTVKKCWASLYNTNAAQYRNGTFLLWGMAVIIQNMIDAEKSGIAFSKDPTGKTQCALIEAAQGVGENIVSGIITPSRYLVDDNDTIQRADTILTDAQILKIIGILRRVVKAYGCEIDSEWCVDKANMLYFLQARPITAIAATKKPYVCHITRPFSLMRVQLYRLGEYEGIKALTNTHYYMNPLFICENGVVRVFYNNISQKENPPNIFDYINQNVDMEKAFAEVEKSVQYSMQVIREEVDFDWKRLLANMCRLYPFSSLGNLAGKLPPSVVGESMKWWAAYREKFDKVIWMAEDFLCEAAAKNVPQDYTDYVFLEEAFDSALLDCAKVEERRKGFLYFNNELVVKQTNTTFNKFLDAHAIYIKEDVPLTQDNVLRGTCAYGGYVEGVVRIVNSLDDMASFKKGEIIVSTMTIPQYATIMRDALAIVTDEGGVLCHAAIVARELKIPCVIGTKFASSLLHNGDKVRINADDGIIVFMNNT